MRYKFCVNLIIKIQVWKLIAYALDNIIYDALHEK